jgi:uncharacterized protein (TIGR02246 family)
MNDVLSPPIDRPPGMRVNRRHAILTGLAGATAVAALSPAASAQDSNPELESARALLKSHDDAFKNQNLDGVLATFARKAAVIGTGPGEIWSGPEEIKAAYENFFKGFDKGSQEFDYHFRLGGLQGDAGWLATSGNIKGKKDGKDFEFPINVTITIVKEDGAWRIAAFHFSTLAGPDK